MNRTSGNYGMEASSAVPWERDGALGPPAPRLETLGYFEKVPPGQGVRGSIWVSSGPLDLCSRFVVLWIALLGLLWSSAVSAAEVLPPPPKQYFNDYAQVVSPATAAQLNQRLENFERQTSSQILVAIYPKMQSDSSIEDYTVRVAQSWKVGQKGKDNGAVLFVFIQDRQMFLQVGYGLEGAIPDALAKRIIETEIKPRFRQGDYEGGLTAGVTAILAAARGEYKGTGTTVAERGRQPTGPGLVALLVFGLFGFFFLMAMLRGLSSPRTRRGGWIMSSGGFSGGGWGGGGWGGGGGDSGGFSGGGGSFGGGGAGGRW